MDSSPLQRVGQVAVPVGDGVEFSRGIALVQEVLNGGAPALGPFLRAIGQRPVRVAVDEKHRPALDPLPVGLLPAEAGLRAQFRQREIVDAEFVAEKMENVGIEATSGFAYSSSHSWKWSVNGPLMLAPGSFESLVGSGSATDLAMANVDK